MFLTGKGHGCSRRSVSNRSLRICAPKCALVLGGGTGQGAHVVPRRLGGCGIIDRGAIHVMLRQEWFGEWVGSAEARAIVPAEFLHRNGDGGRALRLVS